MTGCWSSLRLASPRGCRSGAATASAGLPSSARRSAPSPASCPAWPGRLRRALSRQWVSTTTRPTTCGSCSTEQRQATGTVPTDATLRRRAIPRRARRLAGDPALPVRTSGARTAGAGGRRDGCASATASTRSRPHPTTASSSGCPTPRTPHRAPSCSSSTPTRSNRSSPPRSAVRRCSPPGSANARRAPCCCRAAIRASGRRCGISGSAPRSCSTWPANTPTSRSCSRPSASACRTSTTFRR